MSNLVPQKRLDKNNRLVTKYVRPDGVAVSDGKIPAPVAKKQIVMRDLKASATRSRDINSIVAKIREDYELRDEPVDEIVNKLEAFEDDTLRLILDSTGDSPNLIHPSEVAFLVKRDFSEKVLREYLAFSLMVVDCEDGDGTVGYVQALHQYSKLKKIDDLSRADENTQQACRTLLKVTWMYSAYDYSDPAIKLIRKDDLEMPMLKSTQLANLILDNPDRGDDIVEFLEERGYRISALKEMLTTTPRALKDGWL